MLSSGRCAAIGSSNAASVSSDYHAWEFLKRLPNRFIRDVGFVLAGPPLLLNSEEFPTVENVDWPRVASWLEELEEIVVEEWFSSTKCNTRLGHHFARCVEFVLRFSPFLQLQSLHCSQQVLETLENGNKDISVIMETSEDVGNKYVERRMRKMLRRKAQGKTGVNTVGEFDFLFQLKTNDEGRVSNRVVHHWEVSVKYLLYVGPWEAFGIETPESAKWTRLKRSATASNYNLVVGDLDSFLGCFLGPHVGETLADRKQRLKNQMALSSKASARETMKSLLQFEDAHGIEVRPKALLQGYLFYEHQLWEFLQDSMDSVRSGLNRNHWKGWWMPVEEFAGFARSAAHQKSLWYIVPKKQWLSPVIVSDKELLLGADDLLFMAEEIAVEASRSQRPRMRRFMVTEMQRFDECSWWEVSRGFLVEDSWPDTRTYEPYGYRL